MGARLVGRSVHSFGAEPQSRLHLKEACASGNTTGMKVAVSIPSRIFEQAERLAAHLKTSRSELYARALTAYVGNHAPDRVTETMNAAVDAAGASTDGFSRAAARRVFERVDW